MFGKNEKICTFRFERLKQFTTITPCCFQQSDLFFKNLPKFVFQLLNMTVQLRPVKKVIMMCGYGGLTVSNFVIWLVNVNFFVNTTVRLKGSSVPCLQSLFQGIFTDNIIIETDIVSREKTTSCSWFYKF